MSSLGAAFLALAACGAPPEPSTPSPTTLTVRADADVTLDVTFGALLPFGIERRDGPLDPTARLGACACPCGEPCPTAARPETQTVTLRPGEPYDATWDGRLSRMRHEGGAWCCETFDPPVGRYVVAACDAAGACARTEVSLPATAPVVVGTSAAATADACDDLDLAAVDRDAAQWVTELGVTVRDRPLSACEVPATCVAPADLEGALASARGAACALFAVPRGREVEVLAFLPLPPGASGGERFSRFTDPDLTRVFRVDLGGP